jgi:ABC-type nickel/cobalt efflux system permease component RcnA
MVDFELMTLLGLGFLLGARHALDADHIAAVSTLLSRRPNLQTSGFLSFCWGFGHTIMLLLVALVVIVFKITIPQSLVQVFEFGIGVMLVGLGTSLGWSLYKERWHFHAHDHDGARHVHLHRHPEDVAHDHAHWLRMSVRPMLVGMAHGLAGSAALTLMVLSSVQTLGQGLAYILVFGLGSIVGMIGVGLMISVPLVFSSAYGRRAQVALQGLAGVGSVVLGLLMMVRIGVGEP